MFHGEVSVVFFNLEVRVRFLWVKAKCGGRPREADGDESYELIIDKQEKKKKSKTQL